MEKYWGYITFGLGIVFAISNMNKLNELFSVLLASIGIVSILVGSYILSSKK